MTLNWRNLQFFTYKHQYFTLRRVRRWVQITCAFHSIASLRLRHDRLYTATNPRACRGRALSETLSKHHLDPRFVELRHDPWLTGERSNEWEVAFWLKPNLGDKFRFFVTEASTAESIKQDLTAVVERHIPIWRERMQ